MLSIEFINYIIHADISIVDNMSYITKLLSRSSWFSYNIIIIHMYMYFIILKYLTVHHLLIIIINLDIFDKITGIINHIV